MIATLHVAPEVVELSRHACWLGHAFDEARSADPSLPRPFLEIVRRLAAATISPERVEDEFWTFVSVALLFDAVYSATPTD